MAETRSVIRFLLNDVLIEKDDVKPSDTLLDFIRLQARLVGTKEGCAEGDCGACTILVGRLVGGDLVYETVNSCIRLLPSLDGCHVVTVEHLRGREGALHPVQEAMIANHGSQCGFCTPGIVMSLYALWMNNPEPTSEEIEIALQGNLCRCTGYEPIIKAAHHAAKAGGQEMDRLRAERSAIIAHLSDLDDEKRVLLDHEAEQAILPASVDDFAAALADHPSATIVSGSTDVGLWVTKFMRDISPTIFINHLDELRTIDVSDQAIRLGAGVSYSEAEAVLADVFPHLTAYWKRIGGWQVRNMGTIGGNIANGSPIGDMPPVLIALKASITLRSAKGTRDLLLEDFFIDYGKQDRRADEFLEAITIPRADEPWRHAAYKISKRRDEDISSVCAGLSVLVEQGVVCEARLAFGGMAATPKRARHAENALLGNTWSEASVLAAASCLEQDFSPISDWRASARYRSLVARNLLVRFYRESMGDVVQLDQSA